MIMPAQCNTVNMLKVAEALESGKYPQGRKQLVTLSEGDRFWHFCCLGVACDVAREDGVGGWSSHIRTREIMWVDSGAYAASTPYRVTFASLSEGMIAWLGVDTDVQYPHQLMLAAGHIPIDDYHHTGSQANDHGDSFDDIAARIRSYYGLGARPE